MEEDTRVDKAIDSIFNIKKSTIYLILIFLGGLLLRLIAAINLSVTADDMVFVVHAIDFLSAGRLVVYHQSAGLWFAFTNVMYNLFGTTQLASRLAAVLFGSFSIFAMFLLTKEFFSKKIALISAFLLALATFHIKNTVAEMDVMAMFFVLMSMVLFIGGLKQNKTLFYAISGIFMGLAIYTKVYPMLFIPSLLLYFVYFKKKQHSKIFEKSNYKKIFLFLLIIFIFTLPALTHNYLLYKDKGFMDLQFTRTLGLGTNVSEQYYSWDPIWGKENSWSGLLLGDETISGEKAPLLWVAIKFIIVGDPINFFLGLLGIAFLFSRKSTNKDYLVFFFLSILFVLPFLASIILLSKHFLFLEVLLIPLAALAVKRTSQDISNMLGKNTAKLLLLILFIPFLLLLGSAKGGFSHFYGKSHIAQMIDYKEENIPADALLVGDSRIYRGRLNWALQGRPYLEGSEFVSLLNVQAAMEGETVPIEIYFFECIPDDCGWGYVENQPEFNATMEELTAFFSQHGTVVKEISEPKKGEFYLPLIAGEKEETIRIHRMQANVKKAMLYPATQPKKWFLYDIGYKPKASQFDYYNTRGVLDPLLDKLAHWIVYLSLLLVFLSPIYVIYIILKEKASL